MPSHILKFILLAVLAGCSPEEIPSAHNDAPIPIAESHSSSSQKTVSQDAAEATTGPQSVEIEGVNFTIPENWKRADLSAGQAGFISARYLIPIGDAEAQLTFSTARGGIDANFDRWRGQFQLAPGTEPLRDQMTLSDGTAHWLDLRGIYTATTGFTAPDPEEGVRMIGVGIPLADGEMYLKLLGPADRVAKISDAMRDVVKSADW